MLHESLTTYSTSCTQKHKPLCLTYLYVFTPKFKIKWESCRRFAIPPVYYDFGNGSKVLDLNFQQKKYHKSINNMQKKKLITIAAFVQSLFHLRLCQFVKWIENSQEKFEHWKSKCLRKMGSFHRNLNLEKALVLWCAASEVKTEARFEISTKFYLRYMSLELSYTVWKFFGTP